MSADKYYIGEKYVDQNQRNNNNNLTDTVPLKGCLETTHTHARTPNTHTHHLIQTCYLQEAVCQQTLEPTFHYNNDNDDWDQSIY